MTHFGDLAKFLHAVGGIDFAQLLIALSRVGHAHLIDETYLAHDARNCGGGIGLRAETSFAYSLWRASAAPAACN